MWATEDTETNRIPGMTLGVASTVAGLNPAASTAVGIVQNVTMLAVGIFGVEESLNQHIKEMLERTNVIYECDQVGQDLSGEAIHLMSCNPLAPTQSSSHQLSIKYRLLPGYTRFYWNSTR
jgi:hypothetical protein